MNQKKLKKAIDLSQKTGFICIATSSSNGTPHIAAAGKVELTDKDHLAITEWFCPATLANLEHNKAVSIALWDKDSDTGCQIIGQLERIEDLSILDGYAPAAESQPPLPQVERKLFIKIKKTTDFRLGPHSDAED